MAIQETSFLLLMEIFSYLSFCASFCASHIFFFSITLLFSFRWEKNKTNSQSLTIIITIKIIIIMMMSFFSEDYLLSTCKYCIYHMVLFFSFFLSFFVFAFSETARLIELKMHYETETGCLLFNVCGNY